jgi:lipopolysaccharide export system permease protein
MPIYCGILIILASVIMFNTNKQKSFIFNLVLGILISVIIYYINFIFNAIGNSGKIPINISVFFPFILITIISAIGLVGINEK